MNRRKKQNRNHNHNPRGHQIKHLVARSFKTAMLLSICETMYAHANEIVSQLNSLSSFVLSIIQAGGVIVAAWGVFEFANAYQAHDGTQQTQALKRLVAGLIMFGAGSIMSLLGVS